MHYAQTALWMASRARVVIKSDLDDRVNLQTPMRYYFATDRPHCQWAAVLVTEYFKLPASLKFKLVGHTL